MDLLDPLLSQPMYPSFPPPAPPAPLAPLPLLPGSPPGSGYALPLTQPSLSPLPAPPLQVIPALTPAVPLPLTVPGEALLLLEEALGTSNDPVGVLRYCLSHGGDDAEIRQALDESLRLTSARESKAKTFDAPRNVILSERGKLVDQMTALIARQKEVRRVSGAGSPEDVEIAASLKSLGVIMTSINGRLDALDAEAAQALEAYPSGSDPKILFPLYVMKRPGSVTRAAIQAIADAEKKAQAEIKSLTEADQAQIEADKKDFQLFVQAQAEKRLAPAKEKVTASQNLISTYEAMKNAAEAKFNALKDQIGADSNTLQDAIYFQLNVITPGGVTMETAKSLNMDSIVKAVAQYAANFPNASDHAIAVRLANNISNIDFELSQKEAVFKQAREQIKIGQDSLRWAMAFYESEREKISSPFFEAECKKLWNEEKAAEKKLEYERLGLTIQAQQERLERERSYRYQFNVIYSHVLDQKRRLLGLNHRLEAESLRLEGVKLPEIAKMSFEDKKKLKAGAESYSKKTAHQGKEIKDRYIELNQKSGALSADEEREIKGMLKTLQLTRSSAWCLTELGNDLDFQSAYINEQAENARKASLASTAETAKIPELDHV